jgi:uncharacterized protein
MNILSLFFDLLLTAYLIWDAIQFIPQYRRVKRAISQGDSRARMRLYRRVIVFEWISALLAFCALRFDWSRLNPKTLHLENLSLLPALSPQTAFGRGVVIGVEGVIALALIGFLVVSIARQGTVSLTETAAASRWSKLVPDFSALIPVSRQERLGCVALAISAGVGEEIVFRGWMLATLKSRFGLGGTMLVVVAALAFGLAHAYQGLFGVMLTGIYGVIFCELYVTTGSLLVPIVLHALVDLRLAFTKAPEAQGLGTAPG